jgi:DNA repair protein RecO (recombination protein O)
MPDRTRVYRTEAIVLRHSDFGEADRLLSVFTPHLGKVRLLAKGIRKPASRKAGHLELFTRTQLLIARGRNLDIVTQAQTVEPYLPLRQDLWRMSHAYYVGELVDSFGEEQAENEPLYTLLCQALGWICTSDDLALTMRFFELRLLSLVGYQPQLFQCLHCKAPLEPVVNYFSAEEGGMVCPRCAENQPRQERGTEYRRGMRPIALGSLKALRYLQTRGYEECIRLQLQLSTRAEVEEVLQQYLVYVLERRLKSVEFMHLLRGQGAPSVGY